MSAAPWLTGPEAAAYSRRHPVTIRRALEAGDLHGSQRVKGGRWLIAADCLDAWIGGRPCEHQATASRFKRHAS